MASQGRSTPRSTSRSKRRSATNLSDLRLAPLSTRFAEPAKEDAPAKSPRTLHEERDDGVYARQHSSYIQGKSAPSTPGILSRSSSRKQLRGGLSRRGSLYDDDVQYKYGAVRHSHGEGAERAEVGSGQIPKAKSEAALLLQQRLSGHGVARKKEAYGRSRTGANTPRTKSSARHADNEDWLARTRAATHEILQEAKGQSWIASRDSSTTLTHLESDDDDVDEGYEEMAALSASQARLESPTAASRVRSPMWGSRYGSRSASRMNSRRGSITGQRTPLAFTTLQADGEGEEYFPSNPPAVTIQPDFVDPEPEDAEDTDAEGEVARLSDKGSYGLGGIVDRLMGFNLFSGSEHEEGTDDEGRGTETDDQAKERRAAVAKGQFEEQEKRAAVPPAPHGSGGEGEEGRWQDDAAWLLSVASRAIF